MERAEALVKIAEMNRMGNRKIGKGGKPFGSYAMLFRGSQPRLTTARDECRAVRRQQVSGKTQTVDPPSQNGSKHQPAPWDINPKKQN